ncbi:choice-of-anchor J domain-containing protein [Epilithonimonas sp.]|uniref:choice-of-anchor J domain-containing protein n=1 Tax=Epilithonimonas sp. TaxID=2894511 RepID=UPI0035B079B9
MKKILLSSFMALGILANAQFSENFDASTSAPAGWTVINGGGTSTFIFSAGAPGSALSAPNAAQINYDAVAHDDYLVTPAITVTAGVNDRLTFFVKNQDPAYVENYDVKLSTTTATAAAFTTFLKANGPAPNAWTQVVLDLTPYVGQTIYIGFHATSADMFRLLFDNVVNDTAPTAAPNCPSPATPANNATNIDNTATTLTWTAPTGGGPVSYYELYMDTNANPTTKIGNYVNPTATFSTATSNALLAGTQYYWKVVAVNSAGSSTGCSSVYNFTTKANPFQPYCSGSLTYSSGIEPITSVAIADMTNASAATSTVSHEDFISKVATVEQGKTYTITFQGNTGGNFTDRFLVFADWNKDGDFADAGETFFGTTATAVALTNSTGADGKTVTGSITVPATATLGNTRMRIKKNYGTTSFYLSPCFSSGTTTTATSGTTGYGQAEDYTLNIIAPVLAVSDVNKGAVSVYPNPFKDVLKISDIKGVESIQISDMSGRAVKTLEPASEINLSSLKEGLYIINLKMEDGSTKTFKAIKK